MSIISYPESAHKNNLQVSSKLANRFFKPCGYHKKNNFASIIRLANQACKAMWVYHHKPLYKRHLLGG